MRLSRSTWKSRDRCWVSIQELIPFPVADFHNDSLNGYLIFIVARCEEVYYHLTLRYVLYSKIYTCLHKEIMHMTYTTRETWETPALLVFKPEEAVLQGCKTGSVIGPGGSSIGVYACVDEYSSQCLQQTST